MSRFMRMICRKIACRDPLTYANYLRRTTEATIGEGTLIYPGASIGGEQYLVKIGSRCCLTNGVIILTHDGGVSVLGNIHLCENPDRLGEVVIGDNVFIGIRSIIMPGCTIGNNVVIGAGSIVTKDIPDNTVAAGIPAKPLMTITEYYEKNKGRVLPTQIMSKDQKKRVWTEYFSLNSNAK